MSWCFWCRFVIRAHSCAIRCSYGRNKGASWNRARNGVLVLIRYVSLVTRRGHIILAKKARKFRGACWWSNPIFKTSQRQFNCLWSLNLPHYCKGGSWRTSEFIRGFSMSFTLLHQFRKKVNLQVMAPVFPPEDNGSDPDYQPGLPVLRPLLVIYCICTITLNYQCAV